MISHKPFASFVLLTAIACGPARQAGGICDPFAQGSDSCNGQTVQITGTYSPHAEQHPLLTPDKRESYWDVAKQGQWIFVSDDTINCTKDVLVTGILRSRVGPCDSRANNKNQYCGTAVYVKNWQCK